MHSKKELGKKIRLLRETKRLSRETLCEDESQLTVRQLARIESGQSLPSLYKLEFICNQLHIPLSFLLEEKYLTPPFEYYQIKDRLMNFASYGLRDKIQEKDDLYEIIFKKYYDYLPEEEQVAIDIMHATSDVVNEHMALYGQAIIDDYFDQVKLKSSYTLNDLLIIRLYLSQVDFTNEHDFDDNLIDTILSKVLNQVDFIHYNMVNFGISFYIDSITTLFHYKNFNRIEEILTCLDTLIHIDKKAEELIICTMLKAKWYLYAKNSIPMTKYFYQQAIDYANLFNEVFLADKLTDELELDLKRFATGKFDLE